MRASNLIDQKALARLSCSRMPRWLSRRSALGLSKNFVEWTSLQSLQPPGSPTAITTCWTLQPVSISFQDPLPGPFVEPLPRKLQPCAMDRAEGCLVGVAVGDAAGAPLVSGPWQALEPAAPPRIWRSLGAGAAAPPAHPGPFPRCRAALPEPQPGGPLQEHVKDGPGQRTKLDAALAGLRRRGWQHRWTDDTELTVCLARGAGAGCVQCTLGLGTLAPRMPVPSCCRAQLTSPRAEPSPAEAVALDSALTASPTSVPAGLAGHSPGAGFPEDSVAREYSYW